MPRITVDGLSLNYETMGTGGVPIFFMPGGRSSMELMRPIAEPMSKHHRSFLYDRRNCGKSDVLIAGDISEQEIWADELAALIKQLGLGQAYLSGWSAGCRVALITAIRHPDVVRGLLLGWVSGGGFAAVSLAQSYYGQFIEVAQRGGMQAVIETPFWADRIAANPSNRDRLLGMDTAEFIETMSRWSKIFTDGADLPVIGATAEQLAGITCPTIIAAGDDDTHTPEASQNLHRMIKGSELLPPPILKAEYDAMPSPEARDIARAERCAPLFLEYLERVEAAATSN
jgi:pimeloyl-ACP methyl ester carboxylesterase